MTITSSGKDMLGLLFIQKTMMSMLFQLSGSIKVQFSSDANYKKCTCNLELVKRQVLYHFNCIFTDFAFLMLHQLTIVVKMLQSGDRVISE